jgi:hypothetical protein
MGIYKICSKFSPKVLFFVKVIKDYNNLLYYFDQNAVKYLWHILNKVLIQISLNIKFAMLIFKGFMKIGLHRHEMSCFIVNLFKGKFKFAKYKVIKEYI